MSNSIILEVLTASKELKEYFKAYAGIDTC
jgi:hypothetical protein